MTRALCLLLVSGLLASCDVNVRRSEVTQSLEAERTAASRLAANDAERLRVCRATHYAVNTNTFPTRVDETSVSSAAGVRIVYTEGETSWTTDCAFAGDQVTWRLVSARDPGLGVVQTTRAPESAQYWLDGDAVKLVRRLADGGTAETTGRETGLSNDARGADGSE